jgi:hypothetical protein
MMVRNETIRSNGTAVRHSDIGDTSDDGDDRVLRVATDFVSTIHKAGMEGGTARQRHD